MINIKISRAPGIAVSRHLGKSRRETGRTRTREPALNPLSEKPGERDHGITRR